MSTSMLRLLLIRHGVTQWNLEGRLMGRLPIGLADQGRAQIRDLAGALANVPIDEIRSSPQQRTQETAAIIAEPQGLTVRIEPGLDEVWLGPRWQGRTFAEARSDPDFIALRRDPTLASDLIEPISQVQKRVVDVVDRLRRREKDRTVALVSHGDPLRVVLAHFLRMALADFRRLTVETGSLSVVLSAQKRESVVLLSWQPGNVADSVLLSSFF